jgi:hypothetical protein
MTGKREGLITRTLASLSSPAPSAHRVERTRTRCHAVMAQRRQRESSLEQERLAVARFLDAMLLFVLGVYLAGAVSEAVRLGSLL